MKLLVWNIRQGGGSRRERIGQCINGHEPDIVALIEFIPSVAARFLRSLHEKGFRHQICTARNGFEYAVCVLSKKPIETRSSGIPVLDESGLWLEISAPDYGISCGVVHAPTSPRRRMKDFLSALAQVAVSRAPDQFLFAGDFNTGIGPADGPLRNFGDVDRFVALQENGFSDVWRFVHADRIEHTWSRNEKSYRIDHALASRGLLPRIRDCRYSHQERLDGISDHSLLMVEIGNELETSDRPHKIES